MVWKKYLPQAIFTTYWKSIYISCVWDILKQNIYISCSNFYIFTWALSYVHLGAIVLNGNILHINPYKPIIFLWDIGKHYRPRSDATFYILTRISLSSFLCDIGKQCRPRSDAAFCSIWSGSPLFAYRKFYQNWIKIENITQQPWNLNWTGPMIRVGKSIQLKWVKVNECIGESFQD